MGWPNSLTFRNMRPHFCSCYVKVNVLKVNSRLYRCYCTSNLTFEYQNTCGKIESTITVCVCLVWSFICDQTFQIIVILRWQNGPMDCFVWFSSNTARVVLFMKERKYCRIPVYFKNVDWCYALKAVNKCFEHISFSVRAVHTYEVITHVYILRKILLLG